MIIIKYINIYIYIYIHENVCATSDQTKSEQTIKYL